MIVVISGPSGVGKSTLVARLMARHPELRMSVSHTTRAPRGDERDGVDYHFVDRETFEAMIADGAFAEHAEVFEHRYGTARATLDRIRDAGHLPILDIDYQGAVQIASAYPRAAVTILVAPPSMAVLERRLRGRATDSAAQIALRLAQARHELSQYRAFMYVVFNDELAAAVDRLSAIVVAEQSRIGRNESALKRMVGDHATVGNP